ncbi:hypothetical protein A0128_16530 [Leptospira tipperaryensis]|uniref:Uncharacterized protein n=1 Tax=Leptospira tipperaryensis TaxID=2564040 RepID=A0A1D7V0G5_9LEPT|nr:hypothetical protein A0128_16530 [Leptospira tipperaryensis]
MVRGSEKCGNSREFFGHILRDKGEEKRFIESKGSSRRRFAGPGHSGLAESRSVLADQALHVPCGLRKIGATLWRRKKCGNPRRFLGKVDRNSKISVKVGTPIFSTEKSVVGGHHS